MKFILKYTIVTLTFLMSCQETEKAIPEYVIERDKMVEIISEVELTQALIKLKFINQDTINSQELYSQVFKEFDITEEQFNKNLNYYCETPKETLQLYTDAMDHLSEKQVETKD